MSHWMEDDYWYLVIWDLFRIGAANYIPIIYGPFDEKEDTQAALSLYSIDRRNLFMEVMQEKVLNNNLPATRKEIPGNTTHQEYIKHENICMVIQRTRRLRNMSEEVLPREGGEKYPFR